MKEKLKKLKKIKKIYIYLFILIINILIFISLYSISFNIKAINTSSFELLNSSTPNNLIVKGNGFNKSIHIPNDNDFANRTNWMTRHVFDHQQLGEVSMPGTHDSAAYEVNYGFSTAFVRAWTQTQDTNIQKQLERGIRYFDFRTKENFDMYHGPINVAGTIPKHLDTIITFLKKYPKEFVIIRIKNEGGDGLKLKNRLESEIFSNPYYSNYIVKNGTTDSTVEKVRGKILILNNVGHPLSIDAPTWNYVYAQDKYEDVSADEKFNYIKGEIENIENDYFNFIHVNHISYTRGTSTVYQNATDMNKRFENYLKDTSTPKNKLSISAMDYPHDSLIDEILKRNHRHFIYKLSAEDLTVNKGTKLTNTMIVKQIKGIDHDRSKDVDKYELSFLPKTDTAGSYDISVRVHYIDRTFSTLKLKVYVRDENQNMTYFTNGIEVGKNQIYINNLPDTTSQYKLRFYQDKKNNNTYKELDLSRNIQQQNGKNYINVDFTSVIFLNRLIYPYNFIPANATFELYRNNQLISSYTTRPYLYFKNVEEGRNYITLDNISDNSTYALYVRKKHEINIDALKEKRQFRKSDLRDNNKLDISNLNINLSEGDEVALKEISNGLLNTNIFIETILVSKRAPNYLLFKEKYFEINEKPHTIILPNLLDETINSKEEEIKQDVIAKVFNSYNNEFGNIYYTLDKTSNKINVSPILTGRDQKKYRTLKLYINFDDELLGNRQPDINKGHIINITLKSKDYKMAEIFKPVMKNDTIKIDIDEYEENSSLNALIKENIDINKTFIDENKIPVNDQNIINNSIFKIKDGQNITAQNGFTNRLKIVGEYPDNSKSVDYRIEADLNIVFEDQNRTLITEIENKYNQLKQDYDNINSKIQSLSSNNAVVKLNDINELKRKIEELKQLKNEIDSLIEKQKANKEKTFSQKSKTRKIYKQKLQEINIPTIDNLVVNDNNNNGVIDNYENQAIKALEDLKNDLIEKLPSLSTIQETERNQTRQELNNLYTQKEQLIKEANSNGQVDDIKSSTIIELNSIFNQINKKDINNIKTSIKKEIDELLLEKNNLIDNTYLNKNTKEQLKERFLSIKSNNFNKLDKLTNKKEIENLKQTLLQEINSVSIKGLETEENDKNQAIVYIEEKENERKAYLNNLYTNTKLEKQEAESSLLNIKNTFKEMVKSLKSPEEILNLKLETERQINNTNLNVLNTEQIDKKQANSLITNKSNEKEEEINNIYQSTILKLEKIKTLNTFKEEIISNINNSKEKESIDLEKQKGLEKISSISLEKDQNEKTKKQDTINNINEKLENRINLINTTYNKKNKKEELKTILDEEVEKINEEINNSKSPEDIDKLYEKITIIIEKDSLLLDSEDQDKQKAISFINQKFKEKETKINNIYSKEKDKQTSIKELKEIVRIINDNIEKSLTFEDIQKFKAQGEKQINDFSFNSNDNEENDKQQALKAISESLKEKEDSINNTYQNENTKESLINSLKESLRIINETINNFKTPEGVVEEKNKALALINQTNISELDTKHTDINKAISLLSNEFIKKQDSINNAYQSQKDKDNLISELKEAIKVINENIEKSLSPKEVEKNKLEGINKIDSYSFKENYNHDNEKQHAIKVINSSLKEKQEIINNTYQNKSKKESVLNTLNEKVRIINLLINNSKTPEGVEKEKNRALNLIKDTNISELNTKQTDINSAILLINKAFNQKQDSINNTYQSQENKNIKINELKEIIKNIKKNINNSLSPDDILIEKDNGILLINNILLDSLESESLDKQTAINALNNRLKEKEEEFEKINSNKEDKQKALVSLNEKIKVYIEKIKNSKTPEEVLENKTIGLEEINSTNLLINNTIITNNEIINNIENNSNNHDAFKKEVIISINNKLKEKEEEIKNNYASLKDKQKALETLKEKAKISIEKIESSNEKEFIKNEENKYITQINEVKIPILLKEKKDKQNALDEIEKLLKEKIEKINDTYAKENDKLQVIKKLKEDIQNQNNLINLSKSPEQVIINKNNIINNINKINILNDINEEKDKQEAIKELKEAFENKIKDIENSNIKDNNKLKLKSQAEDIINQNIQKIKKVKSPESLLLTKTKAINEFNSILIENDNNKEKQNNTQTNNNGFNAKIIIPIIIVFSIICIIVGVIIFLKKKKNK